MAVLVLRLCPIIQLWFVKLWFFATLYTSSTCDEGVNSLHDHQFFSVNNPSAEHSLPQLLHKCPQNWLPHDLRCLPQEERSHDHWCPLLQWHWYLVSSWGRGCWGQCSHLTAGNHDLSSCTCIQIHNNIVSCVVVIVTSGHSSCRWG